MNTENNIKKCIEYMVALTQKIATLNSLHYYDINTSSENFFKRVLNLVYGWKLSNLNEEKMNATAIDLYDDGCRVAVQVTSDDSAGKIHETIKKYIENQYQEKYDRLVFLVMVMDKNYTAEFDKDKIVGFDKKRDIITCQRLIEDISKLEPEKVQEITNYLEFELATGTRQEAGNEEEGIKCKTFNELKDKVVPLLLANKTLYENYYLNDKKELWDKFEDKVLENNKALKKLFENNLGLMQHHPVNSYSNLYLIQLFIAHVEEFEATRLDEERSRQILFPIEINSIFGIEPVKDLILPSTESLEDLIEKLSREEKFEFVVLGSDNPYIQIKENGNRSKVFLNDTPRLRQLYFDYKSFKKPKFRLESLNFALKYIRTRKIRFEFLSYNNLREIVINNTKMIFVYEYCLSKVFLSQLAPEENCVIVNLYNWNGAYCISKEAYELSKQMNVKLLTKDDFFGYIRNIKG